MKKPLLIAHRGDQIRHPENTLEAFISAFDRGADGVEMDIQLHHKEIIIVHDYLFDRSLTYPRLTDTLEKIIRRGRIELEIKSMSPRILTRLSAILKNYPGADIELTTSVFPLCHLIRETFADYLSGIILHEYLFDSWMPDWFITKKIASWGALSNADVVHMPFSLLSTDRVNTLHDQGFLVHSHIPDVPNQKEKLKRLLELGVDQYTVDNLDLPKITMSDI